MVAQTKGKERNMSLRKKLERSMYEYVDQLILPVCYDISCKMFDEGRYTYEQFAALVLEGMKGEKE